MGFGINAASPAADDSDAAAGHLFRQGLGGVPAVRRGLAGADDGGGFGKLRQRSLIVQYRRRIIRFAEKLGVVIFPQGDELRMISGQQAELLIPVIAGPRLRQRRTDGFRYARVLPVGGRSVPGGCGRAEPADQGSDAAGAQPGQGGEGCRIEPFLFYVLYCHGVTPFVMYCGSSLLRQRVHFVCVRPRLSRQSSGLL